MLWILQLLKMKKNAVKRQRLFYLQSTNCLMHSDFFYFRPPAVFVEVEELRKQIQEVSLGTVLQILFMLRMALDGFPIHILYRV